LNGTNVFTGTNRFAGVTIATNVNSQFAGTFTGSGAGLSSLGAGNLTGTISDARLSANVALLNANATFSGTVTASGFTGNGSGITNVDLRVANSAGAIAWVTNFNGFTPSASISVADQPVFVASGDISGDGRPDLISARGCDERWLWRFCLRHQYHSNQRFFRGQH
jgi:hypothetical protein